MKRIVMIMVCLVLITGCAGSVKPEFNPQIKTSMEYFEKNTFTALVDFHVHGNHYIDENGKPLEDEEQSARLGSKGLMTKDFAVAKAAQGYIFSFGLTGEREMYFGVSETTGLAAAWNPSNIYVRFTRPITQQDVTPAGVAKTLSSMLMFDDFKPGSELDDMLEELK